jgi:predicted ferric reductase
MRRVAQGAFWITVYLFLTVAPLFVILIGDTPPGRSFWREFSVAIGFAGLAIMGFQFLLTARFRHVAQPYGIDILYHFHRQISFVAFALIMAHPIILFIDDPADLRLLNFFDAPWRARFGLLAIVALIILIVTSVWRLRLNIKYETWRLAHGILGTLAIALAMGHIALVGHYVETPWKQAFWLALTATWISLLVYIRIVKPLMLLRRPYFVEKVIEEKGNSWTLVMKPDGHKGMRFMPGQFAWITLWNSPYAITEHPFSFSGSAATTDGGRLAFTIKEVGDFTETIKTIEPGKRAYLDGPYGIFSIDRHTGPGYVFLAGGIGITPIMSMLRTMVERSDQRPVLMFYANKTWDGVTFREEIEDLQKKLNMRLVHVIEQPPEDWTGESGFVDAEMIDKYLEDDRDSRQYFVCGPDPMMDAVEAALAELNLPFANIHSERYNLV